MIPLMRSSLIFNYTLPITEVLEVERHDGP